MNTALSFTPLLRNPAGFERWGSLLEPATTAPQDVAPYYPPYDILRRGEDHYDITMAVPGFSEEDLDITVHEDRLTISGQVAKPAETEAEQEREAEAPETSVEYLHRGIATRAFERSFRLGEYMKVTSAELKDGLLTVHVVREVPEEAKPRSISIKRGEQSGSSGNITAIHAGERKQSS